MKTLDRFGRVDQVWMQKLDRKFLPKLGMGGFEDLTHSTTADLSSEQILVQPPSRKVS
jgi:hypothetical protein